MTMERIGKGMFSTVYKETSRTILIRSNCPQKECIALFGLSGGRRWPKGETITKGLYRMPLYKKVRGPSKELSKVDYKLYIKVKKLCQEFMINRTHGYDDHKLFINLSNKHLDKNNARQFIEAFESMMNYLDPGNIGFEISPRNIAKRNSGGIVWLDLFFSRELVKELRRCA